MSSQVAICNMALTKIAAPRITSIDDNTESARLCNALYDIIADEVMSEGPWTSVVTRQTLAQLTDEASIDLIYIGRIADPENYDTFLRQAVVQRLSAELCYPLTGDKTLADRMHQQYME